MDSNTIIIKPILTEKSNEARENNCYCFEVNKRANKCEVKRALEEIYKVNVLRCNIINVKGKPRRQRTRKYGRTRAWKKAIVKLAQGQTFPFFEGV